MDNPEESPAEALEDTHARAVEDTHARAVEDTHTDGEHAEGDQEMEVVSVTEEELPVVQTPPTAPVSHLSCTNDCPPLDNYDCPPSELIPPTESTEANQAQDSLPEPSAPPTESFPITKVQPFFSDVQSRLYARRMELLIALCVLIAVILIFAIGLGDSVLLSLYAVEEEFRSNLVSINLSEPRLLQNIKIHNGSNLSKTQCPSGMIVTLRCQACGSRPAYSARIVGGNVSGVGQFPWQVSLHFHSEHLCGGSIITHSWIVTAAHCVYGFAYPSLWEVYVGLIDQPVNGAESVGVEKIIYHNRYRPRGLDYDIALIKLANPLSFSGLVQPICLPGSGEFFKEGSLCWISGWGSQEYDGETSVSLQGARVPLISSKVCVQPGVYPGIISPAMICAGYLEGGTDSCQFYSEYMTQTI
ncbi:hypothetical protein ACEWY4_000016 [Coilia grayii]|uniref:Peptidase S1 domain-containing protein n=1 Tax=Coilia grayii TaxID=363190 RepID=A0ABD1KVF5_9TELE